MKKTIEVEVGTPAEEGVDRSLIGRTYSRPQKTDEVAGHAIVRRIMECWNCELPSWIWYDTCDYHYYECCHCGATSRL